MWLFPTFVFETVIWWWLIAFLCAFECVACWRRSSVMSTIFVVGLAWLLFPQLMTALQDPVKIIYYVLGWIGCGSVWAALHWVGQCYKIRSLFKEARDTKPAEITRSDLKNVLKSFLEEVRESVHVEINIPNKYNADSIKTIDDIIPKVLENKSTFIYWMTFWPWSLAVAFFRDWLYDIFNNLFQMMRNRLQSVTQKIFSGIADDLKTTDA